METLTLPEMTALPEKFDDAIRRQFGSEYEAFATSLREPPPVSIRLHPLKKRPSMAGEIVPWCELGRYLKNRPVFTLDPLFHAGCYYVQEASSMFLGQAVAQAVETGKPLNVLDLCAAPGGKSTHLCSVLTRDSLLVSNEAIRSRATILSENIQKWGYPNTVVTNNDPADFQRLPGFFDLMVIDAPCSGEGLFRKDPRAAREWSPEAVQLCCGRQKRIITDAWPALRDGGILVYCTCTYNEQENENNLLWLKAEHSVEFMRLSIPPSWNIQEVQRDGATGYRFLPHRTKGEGFFLAIMRKTEDTGSRAVKNRRNVAVPAKSIGDVLGRWTLNKQARLFQFQDLVFYTPEEKAREIELLTQHLRVVYAGTNLARLKHDKLIPEHALSLSVEANVDNFPRAAVDEATALQYLRKETVALQGVKTGFTLLTFNDVPLGWVNVLPGRVNNMYPAEWRIRSL